MASAEELVKKVEAGAEVEDSKPQEAVATYRDVIFGAGGSDGDSIKAKESAIDKLSKLYAKLEDAPALRTLLTELRPLFATVPKAKTAKIVRNIIDILAGVPGFDDLQVELCKEQVAWARTEKRTFLRHRVELRLSGLARPSREGLAVLGRSVRRPPAAEPAWVGRVGDIPDADGAGAFVCIRYADQENVLDEQRHSAEAAVVVRQQPVEDAVSHLGQLGRRGANVV